MKELCADNFCSCSPYKWKIFFEIHNTGTLIIRKSCTKHVRKVMCESDVCEQVPSLNPVKCLWSNSSLSMWKLGWHVPSKQAQQLPLISFPNYHYLHIKQMQLLIWRLSHTSQPLSSSTQFFTDILTRVYHLMTFF